MIQLRLRIRTLRASLFHRWSSWRYVFWCPGGGALLPRSGLRPEPLLRFHPSHAFRSSAFQFQTSQQTTTTTVLCANASVVHIIVVLSFVPLNYLSKPTSIFFRYVFCPVSVPDAVLSPSAAFVALLRRAPPSLCRHGVSHLVWVKLMIRHHSPGRRAGLVKALPSATTCMFTHDNLEYAGLQQVQGPETLDW